jgi:hypothetical protein
MPMSTDDYQLLELILIVEDCKSTSRLEAHRIVNARMHSRPRYHSVTRTAMQKKIPL